jgi:Tol biopolymer transport system component
LSEIHRRPPSDDLFTVSSKGGGLANLTGTAYSGESQPSWHPGGLTLAFVSGTPSGVCSIERITSAGTRRAPLYSAIYAPIRSPRWSPDGARIAFARAGLLSDYDVYLTPLDLTATLVASNAGNDLGPRWSPDGTRLALYNESPGGVYLVNPDGTGLTSEAGTGARNPEWSPDGAWVAYALRGLVVDPILGPRQVSSIYLASPSSPVSATVVSGTSSRNEMPVWKP